MKNIKADNMDSQLHKDLRKCVVDNICFVVLTFISVGMLIASFLVPPTGVIDGSVLAAVGEIFAFAALGSVVKAIENGMSAKIEHKGTKLEITEDDE